MQKVLKENMKLDIDCVYSCGPRPYSDINSDNQKSL